MEKQDKQSEGLKLLKDIRTINRQIEELQELIDAVYTSLTNATVKPKEIQVQTSLPADPMADKVAMVVEYQKTLEDYQQQLVGRKICAIKIVQQMNVDNQQLILLRYFKGWSIEAIGDNVGYTYRWAWEKIHQAEEEFISLYEKANDV